LNRSSKARTIALAIEHFSPYKGGAESYAVSLASTLANNGWATHLYGLSWDGEPPAALFHKISVPRILPSWIKMILFAFQHKNMVKGKDFDVVLGFGNTIYMNVYQSHGGVHRFSTSRKVYSESNSVLRLLKRMLIVLSPKDKARHWIESAPFRIKPRPKIIAISEMVRDDMVSFYGVDKDAIELVYNGIDTERYNIGLRERLRGPLRESLGLKEHDIAFVFISYDLKKKGIAPLIDAVAQLRRSKVGRFKLLVVGEKPHPALSRRISDLGLEETVIFAGPTKSPREYYANCDVLVLPTFYDACSLVVMEAMACGLPAITTTANGASGIITHGKDGYTISHPPNSNELADAMKACFSQETLGCMSKEASLTGQRYSLKRNHLEMLRIFDEVTRVHGRAE
jgi:UDP-glucose:(heptosyl)LPS alpha-1,3-glucosyltransferase